MLRESKVEAAELESIKAAQPAGGDAEEAEEAAEKGDARNAAPNLFWAKAFYFCMYGAQRLMSSCVLNDSGTDR